MNAPATFELAVRFYELDPYGHVNHATYLQYFEAARVHWLDDVGQGLDQLQANGVQLVVTAVATKFAASALLNDRLRIETGLVHAQRIRAQWGQLCWRGDELIAAQRVNFATLNPDARPIRIPADLGEAMGRFAMPDEWGQRELPDLSL